MSLLEPPPMKPEDDEDDDDLFRSAIDVPAKKTTEVSSASSTAKDQPLSHEADEDSSGYKSVGFETDAAAAKPVAETVAAAAASGFVDIVRSDTQEDVKKLSSLDSSPAKVVGLDDDDDDDDDDDLFKSAMNPDLMGKKRKEVSGGGGEVFSSAAAVLLSSATTEIELEDEDEHPFRSAHLSPGLQLSGGSGGAAGGGGGGNSKTSNPSSSSAVNGSSAAEKGKGPSAPAGFKGGASSSILDGLDHDGGAAGEGNSGVRGRTMQQQQESLEANDEFIEIAVVDPHKIGDGMSSYVAYRVQTRTNANYFKKREMSVIRRFSDFLGLHDKLADKYLQNGRVIPPAPDKSVVGSTKVKIASSSSTEGLSVAAGGGGGEDRPASPDEFLERRRSSLERYLTRTAAHPILRTDPDFRDFLEMETDLPRSNQTATLSGKSVMKLISKVGDRMTSMTLRMEETDQWFEEKTSSIEQLDTQLRKLHLSAESLYEHRRALSVHTGQLARALSVLSGCEENTRLSGALAKLSSVQEKVEVVHGEQASADFFLMAELFRDYIGLVAAVKDVFQERVKAWQQWQTATASLTKKRESKVRAELQQKADKVAALRQEIAESERQQEMAQENFEKMSRLIKKEVELFEQQRAKDFKKNILIYLEAMLKAQENISSHWEQYLPEVQQMNHS